MTCLPLYVPQLLHALWGVTGLPQDEQNVASTPSYLLAALRKRFFIFDIFLFGTPILGTP